MAVYRFYVGEAQIDYYPPEHKLGFSVEIQHLGETETSPYAMCNWRDFVGYARFTEFCKRNDLYELFYGTGWQLPGCRYGECPPGFHRDDPLQHGPWAVICEGDLRLIRAARLLRAREVETRRGGWPDDDVADPVLPEGYDEDLSFLEWFEWWFEWAVKNCKRPILIIQ
jgi:hypothetical protein